MDQPADEAPTLPPSGAAAQPANGPAAAATPAGIGVLGTVDRFAPLLSALANVGTFITAIFVVVVFFSKDLQHENLRLLKDTVALTNDKIRVINEKANLNGEASNLARQVVGLQLNRDMALASLRQAQADANSLVKKVDEKDKELSLRQSQAESALAASGRLREENSTLSRQNGEISKSSDQLSSGLFDLSTIRYISDLHPNLTDFSSFPFYDFLYNPEDPGFRSLTRGEAALFLFFISDADDLKKDSIKDRYTCPLGNNEYLLGYMISNRPPKVLSMDLLVADRDIVLDNLCNRLKTTVTYYQGGKRGQSSYYKVLSAGSESTPIFQFFPGSYGDTPFEQVRVETAWLNMASQLLQLRLGGKLDDMAFTDKMYNDLTSFGRTSLSLNKPYDEIVADFSDKMTEAGLKVFRSRFETLTTEWSEYSNMASVHVEGKRVKLLDNGKFKTFIPRLSANDIRSIKFDDSLSILKQYELDTNCLVIRFAVDHNYVPKVLASEYEFCDDSDRIKDVLSAQFERGDFKLSPRGKVKGK